MSGQSGREGVNLSDLARAMLEWENKKRALDELTEQIEIAVLALGESVDVGYVHARYSNPRKTYDYEGAGRQVDQAVIDKHTTTETVTAIDWRAVCQDAGVEVAVASEGVAKVKISLSGGA